MPADIGLWCVVAFLAIAVCGIVFGGRRSGQQLVYAASFVVSVIAFIAALDRLVAFGPATSFTLPIGLPTLGAHFRIDSLCAFFLVVVNLGAANTSFYALGYGRHETSPLRVLPFYPAFLAAMNLVVLADDAFTFLLSWEFMSLTSWAIVMTHHRDSATMRAGYIYLVMASFGTLCLLLAFGLLAGPHGAYAFADMRAAPAVSAIAA